MLILQNVSEIKLCIMWAILQTDKLRPYFFFNREFILRRIKSSELQALRSLTEQNQLLVYMPSVIAKSPESRSYRFAATNNYYF